MLVRIVVALRVWNDQVTLLNRFSLALLAFSALLCSAAFSPRAVAAGELAPEADLAKCRRSEFRVLLDVGHTADVPGARSARGVPEYAFNLGLARQIEQALIDAGFAKTVLLITAEAPQRGLFKRVAAAKERHADLFLSIHHDALPERLLETWKYDGQDHRSTERFPGPSIFISNFNGDREGSLKFARLLGLALKKGGLQFTRHYTEPIMGERRRKLVDPDAGVYRFDELVVLKETSMPAVLLEAGSIVNRQEELAMVTPQRRAVIGTAVVEAVETFCALHASPPKVEHARRMR